jgi:hypothetical protein
MNIAQARQIPIVEYLRIIGITPVKEGSISAWYRAPYRSDDNPSLKVNKHRNIWYDFGEGTHGDLIDLGLLLYNTNSIPLVLRNIEAAVPVTLRANVAVSHKDVIDVAPPQERNIQIKELQSVALLRYCEDRHIDTMLAQQYCKEISYMRGGKRFFGIAFPNIGGGYEIRNRYYKGCTAPKTISIIKAADRTCRCCVFEGFFDFLSYMTLLKRGQIEAPEPEPDYIVLNSTSNMGKALPHIKKYRSIHCYFDNDDAGRGAYDLIHEMKGVGVYNKATTYCNHNDLNDYLKSLP